MFTGIVREIGTLARVKRISGLIRLTFSAPKTAAILEPMDSVAVNGVCLTVAASKESEFTVEMIPETQRRTSLPALRPGARVNLEPSMALTDRFGGHLVFGHVDDVGSVSRRRQVKGELILEIAIKKALRRFLVPKGPVTVDGVSLTVGAKLTAETFSVHLIPETLRRTTLAERIEKDRVNLEIDYFAKLFAQFHARRV